MVMNQLHGNKTKTVYFINHPLETIVNTEKLIFWVEEYIDRTESWIIKLDNNVEMCRYNVKDVTKIEWLL